MSKLNCVFNPLLPTVPQVEHSILAKIAKIFGQKWVNEAATHSCCFGTSIFYWTFFVRHQRDGFHFVILKKMHQIIVVFVLIYFAFRLMEVKKVVLLDLSKSIC